MPAGIVDQFELVEVDLQQGVFAAVFVHDQRSARSRLLCDPVQCGCQPQMIQNSGSQCERQTTHLVQCVVHGPDVFGANFSWRLASKALLSLQIDFDGGQCLP